jgi:hypothetical protein
MEAMASAIQGVLMRYIPCIAALSAFLLIAGCSKSPAEVEREARQRDLAEAEQAARQEVYERRVRARRGRDALRQAMRDPASFSATAVVTSPGAICYTYRARNGFGGMNAGNAVLPVGSSQVVASETPGFDQLWREHCDGKPAQDVSL